MTPLTHHAKCPPSKEWEIPMEAVLEALPAFTQNTKLEDDPKKYGCMSTTIMEIPVTPEEKMLPEQKTIAQQELSH